MPKSKLSDSIPASNSSVDQNKNIMGPAKDKENGTKDKDKSETRVEKTAKMEVDSESAPKSKSRTWSQKICDLLKTVHSFESKSKS